MSNISQFYKNLRGLCEERNLTINELVKILNLSTGSPTAWKNGVVPRKSTQLIIAEYFGVSVSQLLGEDSSRLVPLFEGIGGMSTYSSEPKENSPAQFELTEGEIELVKIFRLIPEEQQRAFLEMGRVFADSLKKD